MLDAMQITHCILDAHFKKNDLRGHVRNQTFIRIGARNAT